MNQYAPENRNDWSRCRESFGLEDFRKYSWFSQFEINRSQLTGHKLSGRLLVAVNDTNVMFLRRSVNDSQWNKNM